jgi:MraZ protein
VTFHGQSTHQHDPKGRLCLPKRVYALVGEDRDGEKTVWLTRGTGGCLWLFTPAEFDKRVAALPSDPFQHEAIAAVEREFWASTFQAKLDGSNRVLLPDELRELAGIALGGEVVVIGMRDRVELWSAERRAKSRLSNSEYDARASSLAAGGALLQDVIAMRNKAFLASLEKDQLAQIEKLGIFGRPAAPNTGGANANDTTEGGR